MPDAPAIKFKTAQVTPPKIVREYKRTSKYAPPDMVPGMWAALEKARKDADADESKSAWVSFFANPFPSAQRARAACDVVRNRVSEHADALPDAKALAVRVWGDDNAGYQFAIQVRPGVLTSE